MMEQTTSTQVPASGADPLFPVKDPFFPAYKPLAPNVWPWLDRKVEKWTGGGRHLRIDPVSDWDKNMGEAYVKDMAKPEMANVSDEGSMRFIEALKNRVPDETITTAMSDAYTPRDPGPLLEGQANTREGRGVLTAHVKSHIQDKLMRSRAWRDTARMGLLAALAGGTYGAVSNWRKLLIEKDLEEKSKSEKIAKAPYAAKTPSEAKMLGYRADSSFIMPAVTIGAGLGGYELVDWLTDKARKKALENKRTAAMKEFQTLFSQGISGQQPKLASRFARVDVAEEEQEKEAFLGFDKLSPGMQSFALTTPLTLGTLSFLAARSRALKENEAEQRAVEQSIRALQANRPAQLQFLAGDPALAGVPKAQGPFSSRYQIPVGIPQAGSAQDVQPDELDLTKMGTVKQASSSGGTPEWEAPTNTSMDTSGSGGMGGAPQAPTPPKSPIGGMEVGAPGMGAPSRGPINNAPGTGVLPMGTPGSPSAQIPGSAGLPQGGMVDQLQGWAGNKVDELKGWAGNKALDGLEWASENPRVQEIAGNFMDNPNIQRSAGNLTAGIMGNERVQEGMNSFVQNKYPGIAGVDKFLQQVQTGNPEGVMQWMLGHAMGNPNTQGAGNIGNLLGMVLPGSSPWWNKLMTGAQGKGMQAIQAFKKLLGGFDDEGAPATVASPQRALPPATATGAPGSLFQVR